MDIGRVPLTRTLNIALDDAMRRLIERQSTEYGISKAQFVRMCIAYYADSMGVNEGARAPESLR
jgi:hypothetical protein